MNESLLVLEEQTPLDPFLLEAGDVTNTKPIWTPLQQEFIDRGLEYAARLGAEISYPVKPTGRQLHKPMAETGLPGSWKTIDNLFDNPNNFYKAMGFITLQTIREDWEEQDWVDNYAWLNDAYEMNGLTIPPHSVLARKVSRLFICPSEEAITEKWGTISAYARFVGGETAHTKRIISNEGLMRAAIQHFNETRKPVRLENCADDQWLGAQTIQRLGGSRNINFRLDVISSTEGWKKDKLLWWGVTKFMPANQGDLPHNESIKVWSKMKRGPSKTKIHSEFDHSTVNFQKELVQAKRWLDNQLVRLHYPNSDTGVPGLDRGLLFQAIARNPDLFHPGREIETSELSLFYRLREANVDTRLFTLLMREGISFTDPQPALTVLADELDARNLLNTGVLRQLETYIIGLAPPEVEMSWSDFISTHRKEARARQSASLLAAHR